MHPIRSFNRLPLAGRLIIRPWTLRLYRSQSPLWRLIHFMVLLTLLCGFMIPVHTFQALLGLNGLRLTAPLWAKMIFGIYAAVNVMVVIAQIHLSYRAICFTLKNRYLKAVGGPIQDRLTDTVIACVVTMIGQTIFFVPYAWYCWILPWLMRPNMGAQS